MSNNSMEEQSFPFAPNGILPPSPTPSHSHPLVFPHSPMFPPFGDAIDHMEDLISSMEGHEAHSAEQPNPHGGPQQQPPPLPPSHSPHSSFQQFFAPNGQHGESRSSSAAGNLEHPQLVHSEGQSNSLGGHQHQFSQHSPLPHFHHFLAPNTQHGGVSSSPAPGNMAWLHDGGHINKSVDAFLAKDRDPLAQFASSLNSLHARQTEILQKQQESLRENLDHQEKFNSYHQDQQQIIKRFMDTCVARLPHRQEIPAAHEAGLANQHHNSAFGSAFGSPFRPNYLSPQHGTSSPTAAPGASRKRARGSSLTKADEPKSEEATRSAAAGLLKLNGSSKESFSAAFDYSKMIEHALVGDTNVLLSHQPRRFLASIVLGLLREKAVPDAFKGGIRRSLVQSVRSYKIEDCDDNNVRQRHFQLLCEEVEGNMETSSLVPVWLRNCSRESLQVVVLKAMTSASLHTNTILELRKLCMQNITGNIENLAWYPGVSPAWATQLDDGNGPIMGGSVGTFKMTPECLSHLLTYLPLRDILALFLRTCRTFRAFFDLKEVWSKALIDPKDTFKSATAFSQFVRRLPETSIRKFTIDFNVFGIEGAVELADLLIRRKHWELHSLHIVGRKLSHASLNLILRRLWSGAFKVLSVHDMSVNKLDANQVTKAVVSHAPNVEKLRFDGSLDLESLESLSGLRSGGLVMSDNRITHLSFLGAWRSAIHWGELRCFGTWFPNLERLYVACIVSSPYWVETLGVDGSVDSLRTPTAEEIHWLSIPRLRSFSVEHLGELDIQTVSNPPENVHAAYLWAMVEGSKDTLERLEIGPPRSEVESKKARRNDTSPSHPMLNLKPQLPVPPIIFSRLEHLFLSHCVIGWNSLFPTDADAATEASPPSPLLVMPYLRTANFHRCEGLPASEADPPSKKKKGAAPKRMLWLDKLRESHPYLEGCEDGRKGYVGSGHW